MRAGAPEGTTGRGVLFAGVRRRLAGALVGSARLVAPAPARPAAGLATMLGGREELDPEARSLAAENLEADLEGLVRDAADREISARSTEELLVMTAILRWLRADGELPPPAAVEILEAHAAVFNGTRDADERTLQGAYGAALGALVGELALAVAAERWSSRRLNREAVEGRERRRLARRLEELRRERGWTRGQLAGAAGLGVVDLVGLLAGQRALDPTEIPALAGALGVEAGGLVPEPPPGCDARAAMDVDAGLEAD